MGLKSSVTGVLAGREVETQKQRHTGRATCDNGSRDWMNVFTSQEVPSIVGNYQKPDSSPDRADVGIFSCWKEHPTPALSEERQKTDSCSERRLILPIPSFYICGLQNHKQESL